MRNAFSSTAFIIFIIIMGITGISTFSYCKRYDLFKYKWICPFRAVGDTSAGIMYGVTHYDSGDLTNLRDKYVRITGKCEEVKD